MREWRSVATLAFLATLAGSVAAVETTGPTHAIRILVAYSAGGVSDAMARALAEKGAAGFGTPVVEDQPGAGGRVAMEMLAKSAPDGCVLCFSAVTPLTLSPHLGLVDFDPVNDITPVIGVMYTPMLLVGTEALNADSFDEMVSAARAQPGAFGGLPRESARPATWCSSRFGWPASSASRTSRTRVAGNN